MRDSIKSLSGIQKFCMFLMVNFVFASSFSCSDDNKGATDQGQPYDPNQPIKQETFYPDSGGMATRVILKGSNFGTDLLKIKVYYNQKRAAVVRANGNMIYVITPRQPGDTCTVSVVIGKDSLTYDKPFEYVTTTVSTIAGRPKTDKITDGTLAEATFHPPPYMCVDIEKNLYVSEWGAHAVRQINEENNIVTTLFKDNGLVNPNAPSADPEGRVIFVPNDPKNVLFEFDPIQQWTGKKITIKQAADSEDFNIEWKHCVVSSQYDGLMYTRAENGQLVKFDGKTKQGWLVEAKIKDNTDSYLAFNPTKPEELCISYTNFNYIGVYNLKTKEHKPYAGIPGSGNGSHMDGEAKDAEFAKPRQICFDEDGNLYVADGGNHCIRKTVDIFNDQRNGIFQQRTQIPDYVGAITLPYGNVGRMRSYGSDGNVAYTHQFNKEISFTVRGNFTYSTNDVQEWEQAFLA